MGGSFFPPKKNVYRIILENKPRFPVKKATIKKQFFFFKRIYSYF